jgi:hypothetical protein
MKQLTVFKQIEHEQYGQAGHQADSNGESAPKFCDFRDTQIPAEKKMRMELICSLDSSPTAYKIKVRWAKRSCYDK